MTQKLDKEHVEAIRELQDEFAKNSNSLGNVSIEEHLLNSQLELIQTKKQDLLIEFSKLQQRELDLVEILKERYGDGQIDINSGTFTPNEIGQ